MHGLKVTDQVAWHENAAKIPLNYN